MDTNADKIGFRHNLNERILGEVTPRRKFEPMIEFISVAGSHVHTIGPVGISCVSCLQTLFQRLIYRLCWCQPAEELKSQRILNLVGVNDPTRDKLSVHHSVLPFHTQALFHFLHLHLFYHHDCSVVFPPLQCWKVSNNTIMFFLLPKGRYIISFL